MDACESTTPVTPGNVGIREGESTQHVLQRSPASAAHHEEPKIGRFRAIGVSGNDLLGSVLYTCGGSIALAGPLAPVTLFIVTMLLYGLRFVFGEVVTALPFNGGAYSALLNTTSKYAAAMGAILTFLDGLSLCVVSSVSAVSYLQTIVDHVPLIPTSIAVVVVFGLLLTWGLRDSANVALTIFSLHFVTLCILIVASLVFVIQDGGAVLKYNWTVPWPDITSSSGEVFHGNVFYAIFFGVAQGFLGVTGFETTANYVEDLKPGMFKKTMKDMWGLVVFFNPVITLMSLCVLDIPFIKAHPNDMLVYVGHKAGGEWLGKLIAIDAAIVLTGGVLTAYVAGIGVVKRLALDRCLPQFLLIENACRRTNHVMIALFGLLCISLMAILDGDLHTLDLVLALSFLGVMGTFVMSCVLLKIRRHTVPREQKATGHHVVMGTVFVVWGFIGVAILSPDSFSWFLLYYACVAAIIFFTMKKTLVLRLLVRLTPNWFGCIHRKLAKDIAESQRDYALFFCKTPDMFVMNKGVLYLRRNEAAQRLVLVHITTPGPGRGAVEEAFNRNTHIVNNMYPKLIIDSVLLEGSFSPDTVKFLSHQLEIPTNMMFLGCPSEHFALQLPDLGRVRIITRYIPTVTRASSGTGLEGEAITVAPRENTFSFSSFDEQAMKDFAAKPVAM